MAQIFGSHFQMRQRNAEKVAKKKMDLDFDLVLFLPDILRVLGRAKLEK